MGEARIRVMTTTKDAENVRPLIGNHDRLSSDLFAAATKAQQFKGPDE
jgi:hypothetical protein